MGKFDVVIKWQFDDSILTNENIVDVVKYALGSESKEKVVEDYVRHKVQMILDYAKNISDFTVVDAKLDAIPSSDVNKEEFLNAQDILESPKKLDEEPDSEPGKEIYEEKEKNSKLKPVFKNDLTKEEIEKKMIDEFFNLVTRGAKVESVSVNTQELYNYALNNVVPTEDILFLDEEALYNIKFQYKENNKIGELII